MPETTTSAKAGLYLSLAQNAITQHAFRQAGAYADSALREGGREAASYLVATDVALELGDIQSATWALQKFTNKNSFAHLIRQAKVKDHEGQLDSAIIIMEQAFSRIKGNKDLYCWTLSNLGDMYGHASRVTDAYQAYLSVLQKDPGYDYALKGIAWIALSHDHNYTEAKRIITTLASRSRMPEAHLMLKEIAEMENDNREKLKQLELFLAMTGHDAYQAMYAKYLAIVYIDDLQNPEKGLAIAENEIASRPTAQSFALKAWALLNLGRKKEALQIAQQYVEGRTFEPEVIYYLALIYKANGLEDEAEEYLEKAFESTFELGPSAAATIKRQLDK
ncbi:MAG: cell surface protein [Bacteroidota bacterium]